jgi:hypothetical protein
MRRGERSSSEPFDERRLRLQPRRGNNPGGLRHVGPPMRELWRKRARSLLPGVRPGHARSPADIRPIHARGDGPLSRVRRQAVEDTHSAAVPARVPHARLPRRPAQALYRSGPPLPRLESRAVRRAAFCSGVNGHSGARHRNAHRSGRIGEKRESRREGQIEGPGRRLHRARR